MPTWGSILKEIQVLLPTQQGEALNIVRNRYIKELSDLTKRPVIIYASRWTSGDSPPYSVSINDEDIQGFMEAISGVQGESLDLILHTGGGSAESTDAIVSYLRQKFKDIRIIIPQAAMSAGTMLACSANIILMGKQSSIGPIDPQFILQTSVGSQSLPAQAILDQFEMAQNDCTKNPKNLNSWMPMLSQFGPALLVRCQNQITFGKELVESWLKQYMFKDEQGSTSPAFISNYLSDHKNFKTHGKHINIIKAKELGLKITQLEDDQVLQDKILSVFHATMHSFGMTGAIKVIANSNGNCFIKQQQMR
jgi:Serine dehydrogenase proteinase